MPENPERSPHVASSLRTPVVRSERIRLRRALSYLGMTLVLPGSTQLAVGNRRIGRIALGIWMALWALVLLGAVFALVWRSAAIAFFSDDVVLRVVQVVLILLALGWGALLVDSFRLARPPELARRHRLGFATLSLALVLTIVGGLMASASMVSAQRELVASVFAGGGDTQAKQGRFNVLLIGGDAGKDRVGLRADSITVASVDAQTGRTVLVSLPRNMMYAPFPESSPMHKRFPKGFDCPAGACMLNAIYTWASAHPQLYPGVKDPGAQATKEAVEASTGLTINYYALIDLKGFRTLVDAVGGITLDINQRVPIGGGGSPISGWIEPGRNVHLDGFHALWFARSRHADSDYARMARQKCVMNAMLNQLNPVTVLTNFNQIANAGKEIVYTTIPTSVINQLLDLAGKARKLPVSSVAFVPPVIWPSHPNIPKMHALVQAKIAAAEAADARAAAKAAGQTAAPPPSGPSSSAPATKKKQTKPATTGTPV